MQWTGGGLVPAIGIVPNPGETKGGFVDELVSFTELAPRLKQEGFRIPASKPAPKNVVALAKARLREVKSELRKLKALEKERAELERLIAAAENKPRAVVREIKRTAG